MESDAGNLLRKQSRGRPKRGSTCSTPSKRVKQKFIPEKMYLVEDIIDVRVCKGQKQYRVRWQGFPPDQDSWEPQKNLTNVLDIIENFNKRCNTTSTSKMPEAVKHFPTNNSPASLPTPPSTPGSSSTNIQKRIRGASEEPAEGCFPKRKTRVTGRFEYVPKNQLVASKTKYFDDIRDGKIDLSQNDLYSRVKTRRRAAETTSNDSVHDGDNEGDSASFDLLKHEPNSPVWDCLQNNDSFSEFHSSIASFKSELLKSNRRRPFVQASEISQSRSLPDLANPTVIHEFEEKSRKSTAENINLSSAVTSSPAAIYRQPCTRVRKAASSVREVVAAYFHLLFGNSQGHPSLEPGVDTEKHEECSENTVLALEKAAELLDRLPTLVTYSPLARIQTHQELLDAINNQRWTLLASLTTENRFQTSSRSNSSLYPPVGQRSPSGLEELLQQEFPLEVDRTNALGEIILAVIVGGVGRPIVLESLLANGLDPDTVVSYDADGLVSYSADTGGARNEQANWPLLALAVHLGRLHAAQALLQAGARPDCVVTFANQDGPTRPRRTALGLAIAAGDVDMASMLLLSGANFYEVEPDTTALNLITNLISQHSSDNPSRVASLPPRFEGVDPVVAAELQDRMRSIDSSLPPVPPPSPPEGSVLPSLPKSVLVTAVLSSAARRSSECGDSTPTGDTSVSSLLLPSVDSLNRLYQTVAVHHARLSVSVTRLVRRWLVRAGLVQTALVSPCKWVSIRQRSAVVDFSWPISNLSDLASINPQLSTGPMTPILLLVHGRVAPPACYDVWMDDDGPCLIDQVLLDDIHLQRPLGRVPFVTTLYPVDRTLPQGTESKSHRVTVEFCHSVSTVRCLTPTCFAIMIIAVRIDDCRGVLNRSAVPRTPPRSTTTTDSRPQQPLSTSRRGALSNRDSASSFHSPRLLPSHSRHRSFL